MKNWKIVQVEVIKVNKIFVMLIFLILTSCKSDVEKTLINGDWSINDFYFYEKKSFDKLNGFMFLFEDNFTCIIPKTDFDNDIYTNKKSKGIWNVEKINSKEYILDINTENKIINGVYLLKFWYYRETKVLLMTLEKDSIFFLNYDHWNQYLPEHNFIKNNTYDYEELGEYMKKRLDNNNKE
jgi:hypothetical protein